MDKKEVEILQYFRGARHPGKQIGIIAELVGDSIADVIVVLKKHQMIPQDITTKNYKKLTRDRVEGGLSEEARKYIIGSMKESHTIAGELYLPLSVVESIRKEAYEKAKEGKKKNER